MRRAVCPGSFDPVTNGHLDIIGRSAGIFDDVIVAVLVNESKQGLFTIDERLDMLREVTKPYENVRVESFRGLTVDFCRAHDARVIVRGIRAVSDFDFELQMAQVNERMSGIATLFFPTAPEHSFLSSSLVREVAKFGGDVSAMVPAHVAQRLKERFSR